jgi:hypothetical protein
MYSQWHCHWNLFLAFHVFAMLLSPSTKQNLPYMYYHLKSVIRKLWVTRNMHNNIHLLRSNVNGYGCKTHYSKSLISNTKEPRARQLYYLLFSVLTVRLGSFGYTIIFTEWIKNQY